MLLERLLESDLKAWSIANNRKPLLLRGARQVGKSSLVEFFASKYFDNLLLINFELDPIYKTCFNDLDPTKICQAITVISQKDITPGKTLLFLDEIQDCPEAIQSLRYFKEKMPELHVIGAGSLLELVLKKASFRMPVGRVSFLYLYPLSFKEYLLNTNKKALRAIESANLKNPLPQALHEYLLLELRTYMLLGGMPEAVASYLEDGLFQAIAPIHASILKTYEDDFGHYAETVNVNYVQKCFERIPLMIGQQIKYNKIDPEIRSRELKEALSVLELAGIFTRIQATGAQGLPLSASINNKKFKINFIDVGLLGRINHLDLPLLSKEDLVLLNRGALAEQFVGQELQAYSEPFDNSKLYFWARDGSAKAEVDYLATSGDNIIPLEVKAGKLGTLRSMQQFIKEHDTTFGVRISQLPLHFDNNILSVPLYMLFELPRLLSLLH